jgi:hypothetical protein
MSRGRRVVSPRIHVPHGPGPGILLTVLLLVAIAGAFNAGLFLAREDEGAAAVRLEALEIDRDGLAERLAALTQEKIVLERTMEIDREANRTTREDLKQAQDERLALEKEVSFFKQLIKQGGGGILKVQDFRLVAGEAPGELGYSFTVSQLIQDFGESAGDVLIRVVGKRGGKEVTLPLDKLPGSEPTAHTMRFQHFQNFEGRIRLPEGLEPENLVVEIKPSTKNLIPVTETFAWSVGG